VIARDATQLEGNKNLMAGVHALCAVLEVSFALRFSHRIICKGKFEKKELSRMLGPEEELGLPTGWTTGVRFLAGAGIFFFATTFRPTLGPTKPLGSGSLFPGGKAAGV